jgi:putative addiction module component (TIGR02574 family)
MTDRARTLREIQSWPADEQIELLHDLWDRVLDSGWKPELNDDLRAEVDRRLDADAANPHNVVSWEQIVEHVRRPK